MAAANHHLYTSTSSTPFLHHDSTSLYCSEENDWEALAHLIEQEQGDETQTCSSNCCSKNNNNNNNNNNNVTAPSGCFAEQELFSWGEDELSALFAKQEENPLYRELASSPNLGRAREEGVDWILKVNTHFNFSNLTAVLALNYLDRFLLTFHLQTDKPWMTQLAAVACLSVAAKVEETHVPLLLDLQAGESRYVFEPKTIQRMEILVLSALKWRMNPVTPLSFVDYMARRMGFKDYLCWEFVRQCELVIVSLISDCRSLCYLPSVVATAAMLYVLNGTEYQSQLLAVLGIDEEMTQGCSELIMELTLGIGDNIMGRNQSKKRRKLDSIPGSPNGVMDLSFCSDSSNDCCWPVVGTSSASSSVSSSPEPHRSKKSRVEGESLINHNRISIIPPPRY